jgi:hypothetical protein
MKRNIVMITFICLSHLLMAQRDSAYYGVSLSGAEWASGETYPSTDLLDYYRTKGIILIRLPIMWERLQPEIMKQSVIVIIH